MPGSESPRRPVKIQLGEKLTQGLARSDPQIDGCRTGNHQAIISALKTAIWCLSRGLGVENGTGALRLLLKSAKRGRLTVPWISETLFLEAKVVTPGPEGSSLKEFADTVIPFPTTVSEGLVPKTPRLKCFASPMKSC
jgi:cell division GTPase FtsZ